ncbi:MAG TPA: DUF2600 family protein [Candidatus Baltobacteraceae bacterium]|jgi:tetraprenyl-beta-curcumene synthase|nr:DUF2600 family protein [Candidatus Baltobacteraceae bacterium]
MNDEIVWVACHVLTSPSRRRFLLGDGLSTLLPLKRFLGRIVPDAERELSDIRALALSIPDDRLRIEALGSIKEKAFHVAGGCILATFLPRPAAHHYVEIAAPLESLYDYLDNLCDRHPDVPAEAYPVLHQAVADALDPHAVPRDYYARGPVGDDNGYLLNLVERTQRALKRLDGYAELLPVFREAAEFYAEMQTYKHYSPDKRDAACIAWYERRSRNGRFADLRWYEFTCASGSNLHVYAPLFEVFAGRKEAVAATYEAYFPAVSALHILLDSFIDKKEDRDHGDLNFTTCYAGKEQMRERVEYFVRQASDRFAGLPDPRNHRFVLRFMALFYLTHPKVYEQGLEREAESLLRAVSMPPRDHGRRW